MPGKICLYALAAANLLTSTIAHACFPGGEQSYLHKDLPALDQYAIAAEVEVVSSSMAVGQATIEARIIRVLQGSYLGNMIIIRPEQNRSYDLIPRVGDRGILVGHERFLTNGTLVVDPVRAPSYNELRHRRELENVVR